jgi:hypothetical protein
MDVDLAEQELVSCSYGSPHPSPGSEYIAMNYIKNTGIVNEECFPYTALGTPCDSACANPVERVTISNFSSLYHPPQELFRQSVIEKGPVCASWMNCMWGTWSHSMQLVGWDVIEWGDEGILGIPPDPAVFQQYVGCTYWIYKQNSGNRDEKNGFYFMIHENDDTDVIRVVPTDTPNFVSSVVGNWDASDIQCLDNDGDGYYNWGIGPKPAQCPPCPDERDGDDNDAGIGPMDSYGFCKVIGTYHSGFEKTMNNWSQSPDDDCDWIKYFGTTASWPHTGPSGTPDGSEYYVFMNASVCGMYNGAYLISPPIDLSYACGIRMTFAYHKNALTWGNPDNSILALDVSYDEGLTWQSEYWSATGDLGDQWHYADVYLPSDVNKVRFYAYSGEISFYNDIALDDITIAPVNGGDIIITGNETWDDPYYEICQNIIIEPEASLTILESSIVNMHAGRRIVVKPSGELTVDGATITSPDSVMWQGIEVWGIRDSSQYTIPGYPCPQGVVNIKNNALLEHAKVALDLWKPDHYGMTGGIAYARNSVFRNNAKSVHALYYQNFHPFFPSNEMNNLTDFRNCTFEITEDYHGTYMFYKHIDLAHVKGIGFTACDFSLSPDATGVSQWTHGIAAYDAGFSVLAKCTSQTVPCNAYDSSHFTGFYSAVNATSDLSTLNTFYVNRGVFTNNTYGVKSTNVDNAAVLFSNFLIGENNTTDQDYCQGAPGTGILSEYATGFAFEENTFMKHPEAPQGNYIGISITETQSIDEIYKNVFDGLSYANYSEKANFVPGAIYNGLSYFCNHNTNNYADFFISEDPESGIQHTQGDEDHVTGNTFSEGSSEWHIFNGGGHQVRYYYCDYCSNENPDNIKIFNILEYGEHLENSCPSHYGGQSQKDILLTGPQKTETEFEYYDHHIDYNNVKALYDNLEDGGDTEAELTDIQNAQPEDMWTLRSQLLGDSPHLSMEVLKEASDRTDVFSDAAIFDILAANPDELKKEELLVYLEEKENPLPEYMIDILREVANGTTYKTVLQEDLAYHGNLRARAAHDMIRNYLHDTIQDVSLLRNWLDNLGGLTSERQIIASFLQEGNFTDAISLANMIPSLYNLSGDDLTDHGYYMDVLGLLNNLNLQNRNAFQLDSTEVSLLAMIAESSSGFAGAQAKSILESAYGYHFVCCPNLNGSAGYKSYSAEISPFTKLVEFSIEVKPNPARQWAAFDYVLPENQKKAILTIKDASGRVIEKLQLNGRQGQNLWDTRNVREGLYLYTVNVGGFEKAGKIMVAR